jgi:glucose/arabinose dehydrogenase
MRSLVLVAAVIACGDNRHPAKHDSGATPVPACSPVHGMNVGVRQVAMVPGVPNGIPVRLAWAPDDPQRMFVVMREGQIRVVENGVLRDDPFLDVSSEIYTADTVERGLLDMVFHPSYATNGQFFIYYTTATNCVVARCTRGPDGKHANPACTPILEILHDRAGNHNGSSMAFGTDGYLYVGTGDGGGAGDPNRRAQDPNDLLGKILRIDVDHPTNGLAYGIPADNPYASGGGRPEVFIKGLRNPWRFSFDRATGDMWIGDVGQNHAEELDVLRPAEQNNANLGWSLYEANACCATQDDHCYQVMSLPCDPAGLVFPKDVRDRFTPAGDGWAAIVGGETYHGRCYPDLEGWHFYIDYYASVLVRARLLADGTLEKVDLPGVAVAAISSIDVDPRGELYLLSTNGPIYALTATP